MVLDKMGLAVVRLVYGERQVICSSASDVFRMADGFEVPFFPPVFDSGREVLHSAAVAPWGYLLDGTGVAERNPWFAPAAVLGGCLLVGLVLGGWLLGVEIKETRLADRYVTVKGLVERTVKSDSTIWPVTFKRRGTIYSRCMRRARRTGRLVLKFFAAQGITPAEISVGQIQVTDKQANEYGGNNNGGPRYIVQQTVTVSSNDVDKISKAGQKTAQLLQAGIIVVGGYGQGIRYVFNGLNALKPDMITEATKNARSSADRFAADSGSQVGSIRSANQGVFSISAADAGSGMAPGEEGGGGGAAENPDASIMKKVRVVSTVDYYLVR